MKIPVDVTYDILRIYPGLTLYDSKPSLSLLSSCIAVQYETLTTPGDRIEIVTVYNDDTHFQARSIFDRAYSLGGLALERHPLTTSDALAKTTVLALRVAQPERFILVASAHQASSPSRP